MGVVVHLVLDVVSNMDGKLGPAHVVVDDAKEQGEVVEVVVGVVVGDIVVDSPGAGIEMVPSTYAQKWDEKAPVKALLVSDALRIFGHILEN